MCYQLLQYFYDFLLNDMLYEENKMFTFIRIRIYGYGYTDMILRNLP